MGTVVWFLISRMELWLVAAIAYFCGCFNGAVIISKYILRDDVRRHGSGNAGLTNFYRTFGGPLTFVVILCDVLKAVIAVLIAAHIGGGFDPRMMPDMPLSTEMTVYYVVLFKYWAALFCLLGHMFPLHVPLQGRQGHPLRRHHRLDDRLADRPGGLGGISALIPADEVCISGICLGWGQLPFATWYFYPDPVIVLLAFLLGALILWKHRSNIVRLIHGNENKFSVHRKKN